jgi:predicted AAA+ superfamily ATPase
LVISTTGKNRRSLAGHEARRPLSVAELGIETGVDLQDLLKLGGFPEPFFGGSATEARRWSSDYRSRLVREDLQVSHKTVVSWLAVLERLYAVFLLPPFGAPRIRAVKKERKHYQMDWSLVPDDGARFENLVACHLLKWVHYRQDTEGRNIELRYFRDTDGREVDFVVVEAGRPSLLVECKLSDVNVDRGIRYLRGKFPAAAAWQISATGRKDYVTPDGVRVAPATALLRELV